MADPEAPRRRLSRADRRRVIEDAASRLFAAQGYAATKLTDVAAAAGVTKQLLYQHFASKRELHLALLGRHRDELLAGTAVGMAQAGSLPERITASVDRWFAYVEAHPYALALLFRDTTGDPEVQAFYRELQASARMANVALLRAEPQLGLREEQIEPLAELVRAATVGVALWWADNPGVPRATVVGVVVGALGEGIAFAARR
jgi:AcrR family transcriptional regulator